MLVSQVALHDLLALWMTREPGTAVAEQFVDFVISHPVMLFIVQDRHEHVEVRQEIAQAHLSLEFDGTIGTVAPVRKLFIQAVLSRRHHIPQRLEEVSQHAFATTTRQHRQPGV